MFGFGKKKEKETCCTGSDTQTANETVSVKVLGMGCAKCNELTRNVESALKELGMDLKVEHVTEMAEIAAYGVMSTPALVVGNKVISVGKVLSSEEAAALIKSKNLAKPAQNQKPSAPCG